jgi:hypothetical protein
MKPGRWWTLLCAALGVRAAVAQSACMRDQETALRIGTNVWIGSEPLYLARELGKLNPRRCSSSNTRRRAKCCGRFATRRSTGW